MSNSRGEWISALLDGELDPQRSDRIVSGLLDGDPDELAQFGRYRLIGDVMRGESAVYAGAVANEVHQALRNEPVVLAPSRRVPRWLRPVAGLAVAASVASAAVIVAPKFLSSGGEAGQRVQLAADLPVPTANPTTLVSGGSNKRSANPPEMERGTRWQALDGELAERLNRLVIEHREFGGRTGINGPVPHIGFVGYDAR